MAEEKKAAAEERKAAEIVVLRPLPLEQAGEAESSDDDLMLLMRAGRESAFTKLVRRYQMRALGVAGKMLGRPDLAKDAVQDAFLQIYRYRERYRAEGKFRPYFFRVLVNQCKMIKRKRRRLADWGEDRDLPDTAAWPEAQLIEREKMRELEAALRLLSPKLQSVMVLRYVADLSLKEIAVSLELPVGTVKSRLFAGMDKLKILLKKTSLKGGSA